MKPMTAIRAKKNKLDPDMDLLWQVPEIQAPFIVTCLYLNTGHKEGLLWRGRKAIQFHQCLRKKSRREKGRTFDDNLSTFFTFRTSTAFGWHLRGRHPFLVRILATFRSHKTPKHFRYPLKYSRPLPSNPEHSNEHIVWRKVILNQVLRKEIVSTINVFKPWHMPINLWDVRPLQYLLFSWTFPHMNFQTQTCDTQV